MNYLIVIQFVFNLCEETISRTDEGQPRPKHIFNKCGTNIYFLPYRGLVHHHHQIKKKMISLDLNKRNLTQNNVGKQHC